jgi:hypothetical protein
VTLDRAQRLFLKLSCFRSKLSENSRLTS